MTGRFKKITEFLIITVLGASSLCAYADSVEFDLNSWQPRYDLKETNSLIEQLIREDSKPDLKAMSKLYNDTQSARLWLYLQVVTVMQAAEPTEELAADVDHQADRLLLTVNHLPFSVLSTDYSETFDFVVRDVQWNNGSWQTQIELAAPVTASLIVEDVFGRQTPIKLNDSSAKTTGRRPISIYFNNCEEAMCRALKGKLLAELSKVNELKVADAEQATRLYNEQLLCESGITDKCDALLEDAGNALLELQSTQFIIDLIVDKEVKKVSGEAHIFVVDQMMSEVLTRSSVFSEGKSERNLEKALLKFLKNRIITLAELTVNEVSGEGSGS